MDVKVTAAHVCTELVIIFGVTFWLNSKINTLRAENEALTQTVRALENMVMNHENLLRQVFSPQPPHAKTPPPPPKTIQTPPPQTKTSQQQPSKASPPPKTIRPPPPRHSKKNVPHEEINDIPQADNEEELDLDSFLEAEMKDLREPSQVTEVDDAE